MDSRRARSSAIGIETTTQLGILPPYGNRLRIYADRLSPALACSALRAAANVNLRIKKHAREQVGSWRDSHTWAAAHIRIPQMQCMR